MTHTSWQHSQSPASIFLWSSFRHDLIVLIFYATVPFRINLILAINGFRPNSSMIRDVPMFASWHIRLGFFRVAPATFQNGTVLRGVARPFASLLAGVEGIWFSLSTPLSLAFLFKVPVSLKHRCRPGEAAFAGMLGVRRGDLGVDGTPTASMRRILRGGLLGSSTPVVFPRFRVVEGRGRDLGIGKCCRGEGASTYIK